MKIDRNNLSELILINNHDEFVEIEYLRLFVKTNKNIIYEIDSTTDKMTKTKYKSFEEYFIYCHKITHKKIII